MKLIFNVLFLLTAFISLSVEADVKNREELIRFAKAVGLYEQIEEQKVSVQTHGGKAAQQYARQIAASNPELPDQFKKDMEDEMKIYMSNLASLIDTDFAVDVYIKLISQKLSLMEIQKLTEFYESDLGKKFARSNTEIMRDWTSAIIGDFDKKIMVHLQSFINNLKAKASSYSKEK